MLMCWEMQHSLTSVNRSVAVRKYEGIYGNLLQEHKEYF